MSLTSEIVITLAGHPAPKGSMKCIGRGGRHQLIEDNKRTKPWRTKLAGWLKQRVNASAEPQQPVGVEVTFTLDRPRSHYGTGRNSSIVKPAAPAHPVSHRSGDVDKLLRLVLDALQDAGTLPDDSQVIEVATRKTYPSLRALDADSDVLPWPGVRIRLYPL